METNIMKQEKYESMTVEVNTPDGVLYYTICEDNHVPIKVISTFGKAGTSLSAWAFALDAMVNMLLKQRVSINEIITNLAHISGDKGMHNVYNGTRVDSGPAGLVVALLEYKRQKFREMHLKLLQEGD